MLSVASTRTCPLCTTGPKSSAIITAPGEKCGLGDELAERMLTKSDLDAALRPIQAGIETMDAKFEAKFDGLEPRFDAIDAKFDGLEPRFDAIDARFDLIDTRFDAMDAKFDAKFDSTDAKIESVHRELSGKFNLLVGLGGYNAFSPRFAHPAANPPEIQRDASEISSKQSLQPATSD